MLLSQFIEDVLHINEQDLLFSRLLAYVHHYSADIISYHVITERLRRLKLDQGLVYQCFPNRWVARYKDQGYLEIDPIIERATKSSEPFRWFDIPKLTKLSKVQTAFLQDMKEHGLVDGLAVPIFGPNGTTAYFGIGSTMGDLELVHADVISIQYACYSLNNRFMELNGEIQTDDPQLTNREREVLTWIARGKSNSVIADILGISEHTVDTFVRRCFQKLDVTDRISASLKGVAIGAISP